MGNKASKATSMIKSTNKLLKSKNLELSTLDNETEIRWLSSGSIVLDRILGGGFPIGRITEIYGDTSTGKSLIADQAIAVAQDAGWIGELLDTESAVSIPIIQAVGVNMNDLIYQTPDTIEDVFEMMEASIDSKKLLYPDTPMIIVWDSIAATPSKMELDADYGKSMMGRNALNISQAMRKIVNKIHDNDIVAIFTNQVRTKLGVMFGDNESTSGGKAVGFYASVRIQLKYGGKITVEKKGTKRKKVIGIETNATVVKHKCAVPFLYAKLPIYFGNGIDDELAVWYYLKDNEMIDVSSSWYTLPFLDGTEVRFQKKEWHQVFEENYDAIDQLVFSDIVDEADADVVLESEEESE